MATNDDTEQDAEIRRAMVADDLAGRGIRSERVLRAMATVPRHRFVDLDQRRAAYADRPLPIGEGQTISQPYIVALTLEALAPAPGDRALDVGTGSGYAAAVLGELAGEVWSVERHPTLARRAAAVLAELGYDHVHVVVGDGTLGVPAHAPFDVIAVAAAAPHVPPALTEQLADGGRLVLPVGPPDGSQRLVLVERHGEELVERDLVDVRFVPLVDGRAADDPDG